MFAKSESNARSFIEFLISIFAFKINYLLQKFQEHIEHNFSFIKDKRLLIAISGGIDSVALTHLLHTLKYDISLAHCNFKLRENESNLDEGFVKNLASKLKTQHFFTSFDTETYAKKNKLSVQMAARELRYNWFDKIQLENNFDYILTAHQKEDVLETFLINFTRGTGLEGLTGIPTINGKIIRPLLNVTREEIHKYAIGNNIEWREDKSNASTKYFRNKIRHQVIPVLKELNPSLMSTFDKTLENLNESKQIIDDKIEDVKFSIENFDGEIHQFDIKKIRELSSPKAYLFEILKKYGFTEWGDLSELINAQSGKQVLSKTHRLIKDRTHLLLSKIETNNTEQYQLTENLTAFENSNLHLTFETTEGTKQVTETEKVVCIDKEMLKFPLTVRKWRNGDYFYPLGMQGKKKLSKFFKDEKISILEKEKTWLLCSANNEVIWIVGKRLDNRFKITESTTKTLKITIQ